MKAHPVEVGDVLEPGITPEHQETVEPAATRGTPSQGKPGARPSIWLRILLLALVVGLSIAIFLLRDKAEELAFLGYPGIFLISFLAYATVLLPAPGVMMVFGAGGAFNPIGVALAAGAGAALGELSGYTAGFSGQAAIENTRVYAQLAKWMGRNGALTVILLSAVPNPFFDLAGIAAGAAKMPVKRFVVYCWIGETLKMLFFAYAGSSSLRWILDVFK